MLFATVLRKGLMVAGLELVLSSRGFFIALAWIFYSLSLKISEADDRGLRLVDWGTDWGGVIFYNRWR